MHRDIRHSYVGGSYHTEVYLSNFIISITKIDSSMSGAHLPCALRVEFDRRMMEGDHKGHPATGWLVVENQKLPGAAGPRQCECRKC